MNNRLSVLFVLGMFGFASCQSPEKKPNIILIMTDDQGWYDAGFNGNTAIKTPFLDDLASNGVVFNRFYSASAVCSPTRASLITGRNPLRMDIPYANTGHMKQEEITISELLKEEGYATGHFGKWHLGTLTKTIPDANRGGKEKFHKDYTIPSEHGYDSFFCTESKVPTYDPMVSPKEFIAGESMRYGWRAVENHDSTNNYGTVYWKGENLMDTSNVQGDDSRVIMDRVLPFIENSVKMEQPFFSTIWFHTPHLPVVSDSLDRSLYADMDLQQQLYYGSITAMDRQIGRLWDALVKAGIEEETIIFFCSDNGPEEGTPGSAGLFRERKRSLYEGGVRVPAFVIWKNKIEGGRKIDFPAFTSDYLPTILDVLGIEYPKERPLDGISILDAIEGNVKERPKPMGFICTPNVSWVTHQYKLIADENLENFELYDLLKDESEKNNIINEFPEVAEQLESELSEWLTSVENSRKGMDYRE
ncbi:sulfatase family protein [Cyclobacterium qasimii]|uniref:Arylsulfatase n=2 Tax=Cyclobacterium qasimii TaxID=1350429 RepID=S7VBZ7_9BACT|nr:sulfatase-like hydrolase/transferase [Cyclobacterium qasimii]EPR67730.1 Arylsulfatase [Cyclobacterium qasimii M12-11B]GEO20333.1 N-acetylgalactosamine-6-sulfatase [Cyclobacterium qasimii]